MDAWTSLAWLSIDSFVRRFPWRRWGALLAVVGLSVAAYAQDVLPVPQLTAHVIDQTGTLSEGDRQALESKLDAFEQQSGSQLVILMVPTTQPEAIETYAQRVGDAWKIGRRDVGDGLIIVVAKNDRQMRIEVAKALEGAVPDLAASRIIEGVMKPAFRAGDFAGGLSAAVDQLAARIRGEDLPLPSPHGTQPSGALKDWATFFFIGIFVVGSMLSAVIGRKAGSLTTGLVTSGVAWWITSSLGMALAAGAAALAIVLATGGSRRGYGLAGYGGVGGWGWGGGGFGGGGGGGFSSGGGGDFGGGGASGSW